MAVEEFIKRNELPEERHVYVLVDLEKKKWNIVGLDANTTDNYFVFAIAEQIQTETILMTLEGILIQAQETVGIPYDFTAVCRSLAANVQFSNLKSLAIYWFYDRPSDQVSINVEVR